VRTYANSDHSANLLFLFQIDLQLKKVEGPVLICWLMEKKEPVKIDLMSFQLQYMYSSISCGSSEMYHRATPCSLELMSLAYQPWYSVFLSQQISQ
jgi:hypothetical protein